MESLITRLLEDFETGRMSRRDLVRSLALAALAGPAAAAASPRPAAALSATVPAAAPWRTVALDHISYQVADYKRSADFYADLMGWEVLRDDGERQATLAIGDVGTIIIRNRRRPTPDAGRAAPPITGVINHVSWGVEPWDTEGVEAELRRRGLEPRPDMQGEDFKSFHVRDPDGWDLQISNQTGSPDS
ncbi:MAG: VOC family protein [Gemmatimonadetes bacterium]|nr:VOC family protein [Gemmatimonadota bacterium]